MAPDRKRGAQWKPWEESLAQANGGANTTLEGHLRVQNETAVCLKRLSWLGKDSSTIKKLPMIQKISCLSLPQCLCNVVGACHSLRTCHVHINLSTNVQHDLFPWFRAAKPTSFNLQIQEPSPAASQSYSNVRRRIVASIWIWILSCRLSVSCCFKHTQRSAQQKKTAELRSTTPQSLIFNFHLLKGTVARPGQLWFWLEFEKGLHCWTLLVIEPVLLWGWGRLPILDLKKPQSTASAAENAMQDVFTANAWKTSVDLWVDLQKVLPFLGQGLAVICSIHCEDKTQPDPRGILTRMTLRFDTWVLGPQTEFINCCKASES